MSKQSCPSTSSAVPLWRRCRSACAGGWRAGDPAPARWLLGEGWNQEQFTGERRFPTRRELDQVSTEYPILILRSCFHVGALNSRALELLHINRDTVGHYGAFAEVDETGAPNGVVKENVLDDIKAAIPSVGLRPLLEQVVQSQHDLLAGGPDQHTERRFQVCAGRGALRPGGRPCGSWPSGGR